MGQNIVEVQSIINKLVQHFLRGSLKFSLNHKEIDIFTPDVQEIFLHSTIHLDRFKKYPLKNEFCRIFFKKLISCLEQEKEVHEEMYLFLCSEMKKPPESNEFCFHHYIFKNNLDCLVTIQETKNMVIHGTTGMKTWEAAFMLTDWALCNEKLFEHKKVLELGSGVGFTGVAIAQHCNIQSIILTDCHEEVLSAIKKNIKINFPDFEEQETQSITKYTGRKNSIGVTMLDWNYVDDIPYDIMPDILIGADIVYDPSIIPALCRTIITFFRKNYNLEVFIASVIRNEDTFKGFLESLGKLGLKYEEIGQKEPVHISWDNTVESRMLKIKYSIPT